MNRSVGVCRAIIVVQMKMSDVRTQHGNPVEDIVFRQRAGVGMTYIETDPRSGIIKSLNQLFHHIRFIFKDIFDIYGEILRLIFQKRFPKIERFFMMPFLKI